MNQGPKPTFGDGRRTLEVHLFDFDGESVRRVGPGRVGGAAARRASGFASVEALQRQLERDRTRRA